MSGTVTIDDAGTASGSGTALALYESIRAIEEAANPLPDPNVPDADWDGTAADWAETFLAHVVKVKRAWARTAQEHADVFTDDTAIHKHLIANAAGTTLATGVDTNLSFPMLAGETWNVEVTGQVTNNTGGGVKVGLASTGAATILSANADGAGANSATWTSTDHPTPGTPVGAFSAAAGGNRLFRISALVSATADGTLTVQYASVVAGQTSNVIAGTRMRAWKSLGV